MVSSEIAFSRCVVHWQGKLLDQTVDFAIIAIQLFKIYRLRVIFVKKIEDC